MGIMYKTKTFSEIYSSAAEFINDAKTTFSTLDNITDENKNVLYYLLFGRYGNSPISNWDETQFKTKLFSIVFQYGPTWEKRLDLQEKLRGLTDTELREGALSIYNKAFNPETAPSTTDEETLMYINEQNTSRLKKSKVGAYVELWEALSTDVTSSFLDRFAICFKQFVGPEFPLLYVTDEGDD